VVTADVRRPESIFDHPDVQRLLDTTRPYAILLAGVLHHLPDADDPVGVVDGLTARLPVGGHLVISGFLGGDHPRAQELEQAFVEGGISAARFRTWPEQRRFFAGLELVEPGLVYVNDWRPDAATPADSPVHTLHVAGVGRKAG
jgi:S-adenosyl methyltransferase